MDKVKSDNAIGDAPHEDVKLIGEPQQQSQEYQRLSVQSHLTKRTSLERIEAESRHLVDASAYFGSPAEWADVAREWLEFKLSLTTGDELWEFSTVQAHLGFCAGEEGFAVVRNGQVVSWMTMAVVG